MCLMYIVTVACEVNAGNGSRICLNTRDIEVTCTPPAQVCDYTTSDCPDESDELNCPCEYMHLQELCACVYVR